MKPLPTKRWSTRRRVLAGSIICLFLIGLFYTEENWRGQRTWENCLRTLRAQGVTLDWADYVPAPLPDNQNVFGVPEMQKWFFGGGGPLAWRELTRNLTPSTYPGMNIDSHTPRIVVAELTIGRPGMPIPDDSVVLRWDDPASRTKAARLLTAAIGPTAKAPQSPIGVGLMLRRPEDIRPARIFLQCQNAPKDEDVREFLPDSILPVKASLAERVLKFDSAGDGSYRITMPVLARAGDYLAWSDGLEPQFALIRQALRRPFSRMHGGYDNPRTVPGLNFVAVRNLAQTLAARAECHFLLGRPDDALRELTLIHDFCRIFEQSKPMTLLAAMINVAVRGLYAATIADGLRLQAWREPQLAVLSEQLNTINVLPPVKQAFETEAVITCRTLDLVPTAGLVKRSVVGGLCPRGWGYHNMAVRVQLDFQRGTGLDAANQLIFPDKVEAIDQKTESLKKWSAYTFASSLEPILFARACQTTARNQTAVNQALVVCALERVRLARGDYPQNLDALVPQFLDKIPYDVIGAQPLRYRRAADGTFILYSVGWNGSDDRGVRGESAPGTEGDWVWPDLDRR